MSRFMRKDKMPPTRPIISNPIFQSSTNLLANVETTAYANDDKSRPVNNEGRRGTDDESSRGLAGDNSSDLVGGQRSQGIIAQVGTSQAEEIHKRIAEFQEANARNKSLPRLFAVKSAKVVFSSAVQSLKHSWKRYNVKKSIPKEFRRDENPNIIPQKDLDSPTQNSLRTAEISNLCKSKVQTMRGDWRIKRKPVPVRNPLQDSSPPASHQTTTSSGITYAVSPSPSSDSHYLEETKDLIAAMGQLDIGHRNPSTDTHAMTSSPYKESAKGKTSINQGIDNTPNTSRQRSTLLTKEEGAGRFPPRKSSLPQNRKPRSTSALLGSGIGKRQEQSTLLDDGFEDIEEP